MLLVVVFAELTGLYFLARMLTQKIFVFLLTIFRDRSVAISFTTVLLFPGTIIHELAHLFTAEILGVRTGKLTLVPESIEGNEIKTGSVAIAHSDPFRRYVIGFAPVLWGLLALVALAYLATSPRYSSGEAGAQYSYITILYFYLMFAVSNSMFTSSEDTKGFLPFALTLAALIGATYFAGLRFMLTGQALEIANKILLSLAQSMGIVLAINILLLLILQVLVDLIKKIKNV